jgi:hypothetical protein
MEIGYKKKKTLKNIYKDFMQMYEELFFAGAWIIVMLSLMCGIIFGGLYLQSDTTKPEELNEVKTTKIMIKKKNGLWDGLVILSNGDLDIDYMTLRKDILVIKEKGKNGIGVPIRTDIEIENVDSFYIDK